MAKFGTSKQQIEENTESRKPVPSGTYQVQLTGFKPAKTKSGTSTNLNPQLVIVNNSQFNNKRVFLNLNEKADWIIDDFCHAFGFPRVWEGDQLNIPGDFIGDPNRVESLTYQGPLLSQVATVDVLEVPGQQPGTTKNEINRFQCVVSGCTVQHTTNLYKVV